MTSPLSQTGFLSGRIGLASLFLLGAVNKVADYAATAARMEAVGLAPTSLLLPLVIALELIGGGMVAVGVRYAHVAASILAAYTLATNAFFHRFWMLEDPVRALELSLFFKNVSIAGGLLLAAAVFASRPTANAQ
ncbi:MAG: DoxX family protein [Pseudomonadota bacterium]